MNFGFHLMACLVLLVLQTTLFSHLVPPGPLYDPLIPFVVFLATSRPFAEGLSALLLAGFLADGISAAPFGLFGLTYLWAYLGVWWGGRFFRREHGLLPALGVAGGILMEHLLFLAISWELGLGRLLLRGWPGLFLRLAAGMVTGPLVVGVLRGLHAVFRRWLDPGPEERTSA
ncbi:MAG: hypothetical protein ACLFRG_02620 [Desulfococcaceae bacterium]